MRISNGWIAYEGPSQLDGQPIVCIITGSIKPTSNSKTGLMLQSWIIRSDIHPNEAIQSKQDKSVCGNCKFRADKKGHRVCYVNPMPLGQIYKQYKLGNYDRTPNFNYVNALRIGSYGEPTAVPIKYWLSLVKASRLYTGYTQQWARPQFQNYKHFCMASVTCNSETVAARKLAWRTYRIRTDDIILAGEVDCPGAYKPQTTNCASCGLCNGSSANVSVKVHGIGKTYLKI
jgi:hypothetical protein